VSTETDLNLPTPVLVRPASRPTCPVRPASHPTCPKSRRRRQTLAAKQAKGPPSDYPPEITAAT